MIDLICFDCDGVLVDSEMIAVQTIVDCLSEQGIELGLSEASVMFVGKNADDAQRVLRELLGADPSDAYRNRFEQLLFQRFHRDLKPIPGIAGLLAGLGPVSCVTSNSGHRRLALSLALTGLKCHFGNHVFSADDVALGKPAPDLFYFAAASLSADIRRCVVIDDSVSGIEGAIAAGARAIGFTGGSHAGPDLDGRLIEAGASCCARSVPELRDMLYKMTA